MNELKYLGEMVMEYVKNPAQTLKSAAIGFFAILIFSAIFWAAANLVL